MPLEMSEIALGLAISLGVGALVGLERERSAREEGKPTFGGIRTFPLIALLGSLGALLGGAMGVLGLAAPLAAVVVLLALAYAREARARDRTGLGLTTEFAALLVFGLGALPFAEPLGIEFRSRLLLVAALGSVVMAALSLRDPLHRIAAKVSQEDLYATVRFVLLAAVALPLLPDRTWDPWDALNPFKVGVVVVLIAGVSFFGYVAVRVLGARKGVGVTAAFGGLVSSTAVTLTFSGRARQQPALTGIGALAIVIASTIMFPRMMFLTGVIHADLLRGAAPALGAMLAAGVAGCAVLWWRAGKRSKGGGGEAGETHLSNPFSLRQAVKLGLAYAVVRLVAAIAYQQFGSGGLLVSSALAGFTDVDAITISVSRMVAAGGVDQGTAVLAVTLAALANSLFKTGLAFVLGGRRLGLLVGSVLLPACAAGIVAAVLA